jgi:BirA family biotin operon repressor/biotin-[acetyl-CoA-carboxylase] ligase
VTPGAAAWGLPLQIRHRVDSTMAECRRLAEAGAPEGTTVLAHAQSAGRGRRGRVWSSAAGAGAYFTTLLCPSSGLPVQELGIVAGVAAWQALGDLGATTQLKWPNDLMVAERKLGGILAEAWQPSPGAAPRVLLGFGVNLARAAPSALDGATAARYVGLAALLRDGAAPIQAEAVAQAIVERLAQAYGAWQRQGLAPLLPAWGEADALAGSGVRAMVDGTGVEGIAAGLTAQGCLRVATAQGVIAVSAGEVESVRSRSPLRESQPETPIACTGRRDNVGRSA